MKRLWILSVLSVACATPQFEHGPLFDQLLRPRPGFEGRLTNQVQRETGPDVVSYDLSLPSTRNQLRQVKLICSVAGVRYRVCLDRPGLCTQTEKVKKFLFIRYKRIIVELDYIPVKEGYQRLLDSKTFCAAQESVVGREMFP